MDKFCYLTFPNGNTALSAQVTSHVDLSPTIQKMGLCDTRPTMVIVGGANGMTQEVFLKLESLFEKTLARLAELNRAFVVDGGTDSGVMRLIGQARYRLQASFPLVGVSAIGTVVLPNQPPPSSDAAPLEPHHTHFLLVPGKMWGDEVPWIPQVASVLAERQPSFTVLVNGGQIAWTDVTQSVKVGRPVVVIAGTGRTADKIASALRGETESERVDSLNTTGLLQVVDLDEGLESLTATFEELLARPLIQSALI